MNRSFRFLRFGRPWASALVAGALSLGAAGAAGCDLPEELLDVQVGQSSRGSAVVRIEHQDARVTELLLPPEVLRPNEQAYVAARVDCDGVTLLRTLKHSASNFTL